jgi:hypothetical protein
MYTVRGLQKKYMHDLAARGPEARPCARSFGAEEQPPAAAQLLMQLSPSYRASAGEFSEPSYSRPHTSSPAPPGRVLLSAKYCCLRSPGRCSDPPGSLLLGHNHHALIVVDAPAASEATSCSSSCFCTLVTPSRLHLQRQQSPSRNGRHGGSAARPYDAGRRSLHVTARATPSLLAFCRRRPSPPEAHAEPCAAAACVARSHILPDRLALRHLPACP